MIDIEALVDAKKAHRESLGPFSWVIVEQEKQALS